MKHIDWIVEFIVRNATGASLLVALIGLGVMLQRRRRDTTSPVRFALVALSLCWMVVLVVLFVNHLRFPLFLDLMEGVVFQHVERLASLQPVYPLPTPEYVPLAYNVGFYVLAAPFTWVFGLSLPTLRMVAILATIGIGVLIYVILRRVTGSSMWGLFGSGLFAAYYVVMDSYLDTAHSDSCFVLCAVGGTATLDRYRSRGVRLLGFALLVASFWFKQHGALFAIGGLLFVTVDEGWRRSWPYWLCVVVLGPLSYLLLGPLLFGPAFSYFTYEVPSAWSEISLHACLRCSAFFGLHYFWLVMAAAWWFVAQRRGSWTKPTVWQVQLVAAVATAAMGSLDPGSSNNVYIPLGVWLVITGVWGLWMIDRATDGSRRALVPGAMLLLSFALAAYDPREAMRSDHVDQVYAEFVDFLHSIDGTVYAPTLGQLPRDYSFYPAAHWVALEDMIRGPGRDTLDPPMVQDLLAPLLDPSETRYILENYPLTRFPFFQYLNDHFVLEQDLGDRFRPLAVLPKRGFHMWPRYLYRLDPATLGSEAN